MVASRSVEGGRPGGLFMGTDEQEGKFLRKQAWDYFAIHASQRMSIFNFYIVISSAVVAGYFASFKSDSNLQSARWCLAALLCFLAFIFWKLDGRNKILIKNAERALKYFEQAGAGDAVAKLFTVEEAETKERRARDKGVRKLLVWRRHLSYSDCFNSVFFVFFLIGIVGHFTHAFRCAHSYMSIRHIA